MQLPPKLSSKMRVNLESRKGTCSPFSVRALITRPNDNNPWLMALDSLARTCPSKRTNSGNKRENKRENKKRENRDRRTKKKMVSKCFRQNTTKDELEHFQRTLSGQMQCYNRLMAHVPQHLDHRLVCGFRNHSNLLNSNVQCVCFPSNDCSRHVL